jgi:hypothetical protein
MKRLIFGAMALSVVSAANAAIIYSSTTQTGTRVNANNAGFTGAADLGSQTRINFDDVNIAAATMAGNNSLLLNSVTVGIRRGQGALENNVRVYAAAMNFDGSVAGPVTLLGNQVLPPRTDAGFVTELVTISGLTQTIPAQPAFTAGGLFSTIYIGVQLSADSTAGSSGWRVTNPSATGPNVAGWANLFETAPPTNNFYSFGPTPAPPATYYIELDATPVPGPALNTVSGNLVLQNTGDDGVAGTETIGWVLSDGTNTFSGTFTVDDFGGGAYSLNIPAAAANGNYTLSFDGGTFLQSSFSVTLNGSNLTQAVSLRNGDIDNDGEVGPSDFEAVVAQFGGPGTADVDNDAEVGPSDFETIVANFGLGDE